jgi:hypothetical protein
MPYLLVAASAFIVLLGFLKLRGTRRPHAVPWSAFLMWAALFAGGCALWLAAVHGP